MESVEQSMERELAWETELLGENLPQSIRHDLNWDRTHAAAVGSLSYDTASNRQLLSSFVTSLYMPGSLMLVKLIDYTHFDLIVRHVAIKLPYCIFDYISGRPRSIMTSNQKS
jgi:hypothetical protein